MISHLIGYLINYSRKTEIKIESLRDFLSELNIFKRWFGAKPIKEKFPWHFAKKKSIVSLANKCNLFHSYRSQLSISCRFHLFAQFYSFSIFANTHWRQKKNLKEKPSVASVFLYKQNIRHVCENMQSKIESIDDDDEIMIWVMICWSSCNFLASPKKLKKFWSEKLFDENKN